MLDRLYNQHRFRYAFVFEYLRKVGIYLVYPLSHATAESVINDVVAEIFCLCYKPFDGCKLLQPNI